MHDFRRVAIVGCGLIGRSIQLALEAQSPGVDVATLDQGDDLAGVAGADLVVVAAPVLEIARILPQLPPHLSPGSLVTDTGSTKAQIVAAAGALRFIGGHPIAGSAASGGAAARADLFVGRPWILIKGHHAGDEDVARIRAFVERLGARAQTMSAGEHDSLFAAVSHLPQLTVSALMHVVGSAAGAEGLALAGAGLHDSTRLAASRHDIWIDILRTNRTNITLAIDRLIDVLTAMRDDETGAAVEETFQSAARWKQTLDKRSL